LRLVLRTPWGSVRRRVSVGTKRPPTQARELGRPKGGAFLAVGYPGVIHVPLYSRHCLLTALTSVSTSLQIDFGGWRPSGNGPRRCGGTDYSTFGPSLPRASAPPFILGAVWRNVPTPHLTGSSGAHAALEAGATVLGLRSGASVESHDNGAAEGRGGGDRSNGTRVAHG
jgi:hypothetical protein